ncbi:MAG: SusC/RagA family TonB-linked outer membrane protein [Tannerellaceae bacterium]|jgi:TonB-linked SusC/RagA family outer membrane protein|nr:SusC/RagA family TonB-linked outer membrane protein [Tannerellaceae bacterium]
MKILISTSLILGFLISLTTLDVMSQEIETSEDQSFSMIIPGNLFSADEVTSTGAVSIVSSETLYKTPVPNLTNTFSGRLSGLFTVGGNGTPGWDVGKMYIRGIGSYAQSSNNTTLKYYVDGFEVNADYIMYLSPAEISTVSVFKDAAALSTFGMRGADGILWIETKRGNIGAPTVTFQARTGIQQAIDINKPLRSFDYASLYNQAFSNDNGMKWTPVYSAGQLDDYLNGRGIDVDWYDEVYRKNGYYSDVDLSFRGGSQAVRYNVVLGYANQQGLFNVQNTDRTSNSRFEKYAIRANFDMDLNKVLAVSVDLGGRLEDRFRPNYIISDLTQNVLNYPSNIYPVYDEITDDPVSNFSGTTIYPNNPVGSLTGLGWVTDRTRILQANFKFKENLDFLLDKLYLQESFSFYTRTLGAMGKTRTYARYYNGVAQTSDLSTYLRSTAYSSAGMEQWMQGNLTIGYGVSFDKHELNSALNAHISDYKGQGSEFFTFKTHFLNYSGKVNYAFNKRYVAEFGFSYFGSDGYAPGNRYGFYPSLSAAWIASNESFFESNDIVSFLKIRGSVGTTGGTESSESSNAGDMWGDSDFLSNGRYLYQQYYAGSSGIVTGLGPAFGDNYNGLAPLFTANKDLFAEKSLKYNVGLDLNLFDKLGLSSDFFMDKRSGILTIDNSIMNYYGKILYFANVGKMTNKGFETSVSYSDKVGDIKYSLLGLVFYAKNKVDYMAEVPPKYAYNASTGLPLGTKMGLECIGYYQLHDFNADGSLKAGIPEPLFGAVQPGDLRYKDQDDDGFIDQTDYAKIGNPSYPKWAFSFGGEVAYRGFDFSVFFTGSAGSTVKLSNSAWRPFLDYGNAYEWAKGAWAYYPEQGIDTRVSATFPRLTAQQNDNNYAASTFWIRKNDYLRLKNIEMGYEFSNLRYFKNVGISKFRLYVNVLNPLTFSSLLKDYNMDPEIADYGYPALKSYYAGIQVTF